MKKWFLRLVAGLIALLAGLFTVAAALPLAMEPVIAPAESGAGSRTIAPANTGLQRAFPALNEPADNPTTGARADLGRLLFFDPLLSAADDMACASCHHPDYAFTDGLARALGAGASGAGPARQGGRALERNTPSLWNVGYAASLFWDGRAASLEDQSHEPLTHVDEMGGDPAQIVAELALIPAYVEAFARAFGAGPITFEQVQMALAAFQRTLISDNSPFDRYAAGDFTALTPAQRRGLALFRSGSTRCFECHLAPTFSSDTFRVIGVPGNDPGRAAVAGDAPRGAFRVPSLRNVVLTAPYMHDGSLATLEDVLDFYARGGGRAHDMPDVDPFVRGFELNAQEKADLLAFLYALTDESTLPAIPPAVPSGLPVAGRLDNPARAEVRRFNAPATDGGDRGSRPPREWTVAPGESIQAVVDQARAGDTIRLVYGVYHEKVVIDLNDITLEGIPNAAGAWPILDGQGVLSDGVISSGSNFAVGRLHVRNYTDNGILVEGATGVHFYDIRAEKTGTYGVYPVQSTSVLIERAIVSGVDDAGIYAGQCEDVVIRDSEVYGNVIGIEVENTLGSEVYDNYAHDNTTGILMVLLPNLTSKVSRENKVYNNRVENNNGANFAPPGGAASFLPPGVGILILSSDDNEVYQNQVSGHKTTGVAVFNLASTGFYDELDIDPAPERNFLHDNQYDNNGYDPDQFVRDLGIPTGDILWDGTGFGNTFNEPEARGNFPPLLPGHGWPVGLQRAYFRLLTLVVGLVS